MEELTQAQAEEYRDGLISEMWDGAEPKVETTPAVEVLPGDEAEVVPEDPWKDVNPVLKESIDKISSQLENLSSFGERLKQAERRVGSIQNEVFAAKKTADDIAVKISETPSKSQIEDAAETEQEWKALKEDFPEWATAIEKKLSATRTEFEKHIPDTGKLEEKITTEVSSLSTKLEDMRISMEKNVLGIKHPEWETIIESKEYKTWLAGQDDATKTLTTSQHAKDAIKVLNKFEEQKPKKSPVVIAAERKDRLRKSETVQGTKAKVTKAETDMSDEDFRKSQTKKIWDD